MLRIRDGGQRVKYPNGTFIGSLLLGSHMEQQAIFSMAMVPFSVKILWAPIVDSISFGKLGWRKPWIVFAQSIVGLLLLAASFGFNTLVEVFFSRFSSLSAFSRMVI
mgnify:CR=1 FL=1